MIPRSRRVPLAVFILAFALSGCSAAPAASPSIAPSATAPSPTPTASPVPAPSPEARAAFDGECEGALGIEAARALLGPEATESDRVGSSATGTGDLAAAWNVLQCIWNADFGYLTLEVLPQGIAGGGFVEGVECGSNGYGAHPVNVCRLTMRTAGSWTRVVLQKDPTSADELEAIAAELRQRVDADGGPVRAQRADDPWSTLTCDDLGGTFASLGHSNVPGYQSDARAVDALSWDELDGAGAGLYCGWSGGLPAEVILMVGAGSPSVSSLEEWNAVEVAGADEAWYHHSGTAWLVAVQEDNRIVIHSHSDMTETDLIPVAEAMLATSRG